MRRCLHAVTRKVAQQRRSWSDEFRHMVEEEEVNCKLGEVPYYEGHPLVAVMFGWPGATEEGMRPYSEVYDRMGVPSVMVIPTEKEYDDVLQGDLRVQRVFAELQVELCNLRSDILLHFFSTATQPYLGACVYLGRRVMKGAIFDSGPVPHVEHQQWENATRTARARKLLEEQGDAPKSGPLRTAMSSCMRWGKECAAGWEARSRELMQMELLFTPQLFLRSAEDPLLQGEYVGGEMEKR